MASIIEGYNYDIFISYRQKDNKGDRWVSEFVESLKTELESTFKEEISVYFDINPHDGLLETHDVDASLKEKLKCLIFIPVLSRTYCDPKSFAWEHEFIAFVEQTSKDQFGLKVKLPGGNVASRILPVRIHDLEQEDVKLFEKETGNVLRSMDFIFKTASGVNRPLNAHEDHPHDNLYKTFYNDQINKVGNAIKEIVFGLKTGQFVEAKEKIQHQRVAENCEEYGKPEDEKEPKKFGKSKLLSWMSVIALLIIAALLFYPRIFKRDKFQDIKNPAGKISIAVMPFENLTGDTTLNWFQKGISSLIINDLGSSSELAVLDDQTMFEAVEDMNKFYTTGISPSMAKELAEKVKAETYISGSFQGREDSYMVLLNLVNTESGEIIWTNKVEGNLKSSGYFVMAESLCKEIKNYLELKALENIAGYDIGEAYPTSSEAYRYFIEGMDLVLHQNYESGIPLLKRALEIDSTFTIAYFYLAFAYNLIAGASDIEQTIFWTKQAYLHKDRILPKYQLWIELWYACFVTGNYDNINRYCDLLAESGMNTRLFWTDIGVTYVSFLQQYEKAVEAFEKVMEISQESGRKWGIVLFWDNFLKALHETGNHDREKEVSEIGLNVIPAYSNWILYRMAVCALSRGEMQEAEEIIIRYKAKHQELGTSEVILERHIGQMYEEANMLDEAEMHFRKSYGLSPQSLTSIYNLAHLLIANNINMEEGMELVDKGLKIQSDNQNLLYILGLGLYKLGKFEESVKLLSKLWEERIGFNTCWYLSLQEAKEALANQ